MIKALFTASAIALLAASPSPSLAASMMANGYQMVASDALASKLISSKVFSTVALNGGSAGSAVAPAKGGTAMAPAATNADGAPAKSADDTNAQQIGTIRDLVVDKDGKISAVVIGFGGLLGLGEKNVAVSYDELKWAVAQDGSIRGMLDTTADALKSAPDFAYPANGAATPVAATNDNSSTQSAHNTVGAAPVTDPQSFVNKAAPSNMFEIQSSQLALKQAQSEDVKTFAQKMIDDHTAAGQKMEPAAKAENVSVPNALDTMGTENMQKLQGLTGAQFDQAYISMQVAAHDSAVALFQGYSEKGKTGPMKDFATTTLPTLQMHQQMVHQMAVK